MIIMQSRVYDTLMLFLNLRRGQTNSQWLNLNLIKINFGYLSFGLMWCLASKKNSDHRQHQFIITSPFAIRFKVEWYLSFRSVTCWVHGLHLIRIIRVRECIMYIDADAVARQNETWNKNHVISFLYKIFLYDEEQDDDEDRIASHIA